MLKAVEKIIKLADEKKISFPEAVLLLDAAETGVPAEEIRGRMAERLADMRRSVREACANTVPCRIEPPMGPKLRAYQEPMVGDFILAASATAMEVASYNATMGRIVAAPTAGSCGIIPGMLFAWEFFRGEGKDTEAMLIDALITAGAVGADPACRGQTAAEVLRHHRGLQRAEAQAQLRRGGGDGRGGARLFAGRYAHDVRARRRDDI